MIFWSKTPKTKKEKLKARQQRDLKALFHKEHMRSAEEMSEGAEKSSGHIEDGGADPNEGLDQDLLSKAGRKKQQAQAMIYETSKSLARLRKKVGKSRSRSRKRAKQLGF